MINKTYVIYSPKILSLMEMELHYLANRIEAEVQNSKLIYNLYNNSFESSNKSYDFLLVLITDINKNYRKKYAEIAEFFFKIALSCGVF